MLLRILINLGVFALVSTSQVLRERQGGYDIRRSGRYAIVNCGNRNAAHLVGLLDHLWTVLQPALYDVSFTRPSPALRTFFGSPINGPHVSQILTNVTTGVSLYPPEDKFHQTGSPLLMCVTGGGQVIGTQNAVDYYYQCVLDPNKSLIAIGGSPYLVVCPHFFLSMVPDWPSSDTCLTLNTYVNRFRGTGADFTNFKIWTLLDGILRYYISATTGYSGTYATDVNMCTRLQPRQSLKNPSSYVYYVASVLGHCHEFPNFAVPHRRPLENTTVPALIDPQEEGANATDPVDFATPSEAVEVDP